MRFTEEDLGSRGSNDPGQYDAEVAKVEEKITKNGDEMWSVRFVPVGESKTLCFDNLVWSDGGRGIASKKCKMLGFQPGQDFEAQDLRGKRVSLTLIEEEYNGKTNLKPDIGVDGFGYTPLAGVSAVDDPVPF